MYSSILLQALTPAHILGFLTFVIAVRCIANYFKLGLRKIPGPFLASITPLWRLIDVRRGHHHETLIKLHHEYGTKLLRIAPNVVSIGDPEAVKMVYGHKSGFTKVRVDRSFDYSTLVRLKICAD